MPNQGASEPGGVDAGHLDEFVAIREPTMNDLDAIADMLREREDEAAGGPVSDEIDRRIGLIEDTLRRDTMRRFFVAVLPDGQFVGMGGLQADAIAPDLITSDQRPIEAVMVHVRPQHRRRGVGQALLAAIERTARELGYTTLLVVSGSRNRDAYPFWLRRYGEQVAATRTTSGWARSERCGGGHSSSDCHRRHGGRVHGPAYWGAGLPVASTSLWGTLLAGRCQRLRTLTTAT